MAPSEDQVREALKQVVDPELFVNVVDLGLIYVVTIDENAVDASAPAAAGETPAAAGETPAPTAETPSPEGKSDAPDASAKTGAKVTVEMTLTSPACPAGPQLIAQSKDAVNRLEGVAETEVKLVMSPPWSPDRMTDDARDQLGIF